MKSSFVALLMACLLPVMALAEDSSPATASGTVAAALPAPETLRSVPAAPLVPAPPEQIGHEPPAEPAVPPAPKLDSAAPTEPGPLAEAATSDAIPAAQEPASTPPPLLPPLQTGADVFARLGVQLSQPACIENNAAQHWRKRYAGDPASFARHLANILPLLDFVTSEIETSGLPGEFALIPLIESWYRPEAMGAGGPAGMWQMITSTARNHGIHVQAGYDGRLSPVESTRAALSYLKTLNAMFGGDWQAAVMAYNAGEYRLLKAFKHEGGRQVSAQDRRPRGLSKITYDYVLRLQALSCLITAPERQGLTLPLTTTFKRLVPVLVDKDTRNLEQVARQMGVEIQLLRQLNPGFRGGVIVRDVPRMVLMPADAAPIIDFVVADDRGNDPPIKEDRSDMPDRLHEVRNGETLWSIAKRYGLSLAQLRTLNGLGRSTLIRAGQSLKVLP